DSCHSAIALDIRTNSINGLGAATHCSQRIAPSFEHMPFHDRSPDMIVFNAALHYSVELPAALREAFRVAKHVVILDSPFYDKAEHGDAMVREKRAFAQKQFGDRADTLMALPFIEFLTPQTLTQAM